ncbi:MAG: M23 family metallopeptidase, partial [Alkaliphilus sp.]|nr:M23 family metallopeptidase [Alkaliphilus sp.]
VPTVASTAQEKPAPVKENQPSQQAENTVDAEEVMSNQKQTATSAMTVPLVGSIGMKYAVDSLVYSKTLDQFTTHEGIDIIAPINTPVMAAQAGEVIEVVVDSRLGITIAIAHEGNIITRYSNLSTDQMVEVGDFVERGEVISGVGRSALFSIAEEPHLHFEVLVEGKNVDPSLYIPIE